MAYTPRHNYRSKDVLERGDPNKIVKGRELSDDFESIARELSRQQGEIEELQTGGGVSGLVTWNDVMNKPETISNLGYDSQINGGSYNTAKKGKV